jgi:CSLREA domain-containing protein
MRMEPNDAPFPTHRRARLARAASLIAAVIALLVMNCASSTMITVDTTTDQFNSSASTCSLRAALHAASHEVAFAGCPAGNGSDTILLAGGTYAIALPPVAGHPEQGGAFYIESSAGSAIAVAGTDGAKSTVLEANGVDSVLNIVPGAGSTTILIGMTFRGGVMSSTCRGAGVNFECAGNVPDARLSMYQSWITANIGFGFTSEGGLMLLQQTSVTANKGPGIWLDEAGDSTLDDVTISRNVGDFNGIGYDGPGGLRIEDSTGNVTIENSTIAYNGFPDSNSNDYNELATGGIAIRGTPTPTVYIRNSIVAHNARGDRARGADCSGVLQSQGYNLIGDTDFCSIVGVTTGNLLNTDAQLAPLFDYGHGVPTQMLLPGSPAIAAGNPATPGSGGLACAQFDERGFDRTTGNRPCDMGAYQSHVDFAVDTTDDTNDAAPGDGICDDGSHCSLRAAISEANASSSFRTIQLPAGHFSMEIFPDYLFYDNYSGVFALFGSDAVTIVGAGAGQTIIDGAGLDRDFIVLSFGTTPAPAVSFHNLTITGGDDSYAHNGGGGIHAAGDVLIDRTIVSDNIGANGGGLQIFGAHAIIDSSTIEGNFADAVPANGGAIFAGDATVDIVNSTIANNESLGVGGGIASASGAEISLSFDTIADNRAATGGGGVARANGGTFFVRDSIISNNVDAGGQSNDCAANVQIADWTIMRDTAGCTIGGTEPSLVIAQDPQLGALAFQGGPTPTMGLSESSPAHGMIQGQYQCVDQDGVQILADQRGVARPTENYGQPSGGGFCDIGAFQGIGDVLFASGFED